MSRSWILAALAISFAFVGLSGCSGQYSTFTGRIANHTDSSHLYNVTVEFRGQERGPHETLNVSVVVRPNATHDLGVAGRSEGTYVIVAWVDNVEREYGETGFFYARGPGGFIVQSWRDDLARTIYWYY